MKRSKGELTVEADVAVVNRILVAVFGLLVAPLVAHPLVVLVLVKVLLKRETPSQMQSVNIGD